MQYIYLQYQYHTAEVYRCKISTSFMPHTAEWLLCQCPGLRVHVVLLGCNAQVTNADQRWCPIQNYTPPCLFGFFNFTLYSKDRNLIHSLAWATTRLFNANIAMRVYIRYKLNRTMGGKTDILYWSAFVFDYHMDKTTFLKLFRMLTFNAFVFVTYRHAIFIFHHDSNLSHSYFVSINRHLEYDINFEFIASSSWWRRVRERRLMTLLHVQATG